MWIKKWSRIRGIARHRFVWFCQFHCFSSRICHLFEHYPHTPSDRRWLCRSRAFWSRRDVCPAVSCDRGWLCRSQMFWSRRDLSSDVSCDWRWLARSGLFWRRRDLSSKGCFSWRIMSHIRQVTSILIAFLHLPTSYFFQENLPRQHGVVYIIRLPAIHLYTCGVCLPPYCQVCLHHHMYQHLYTL